MHIECWGSGVDFYVACPFYVATALCKRKKGSGINDPIEANQLVDGVMAQIGKKYVWQVSELQCGKVCGALSTAKLIVSQ